MISKVFSTFAQVSDAGGAFETSSPDFFGVLWEGVGGMEAWFLEQAPVSRGGGSPPSRGWPLFLLGAWEC